MSSKIGHTPFNLEMLVIVYSVSAQKAHSYKPIGWICTSYNSYFGSIVMNNFRKCCIPDLFK